MMGRGIPLPTFIGGNRNAYHMEYDVALKEAIRDSAKKFLDAEKAELVEEKGRNSKG